MIVAIAAVAVAVAVHGLVLRVGVGAGDVRAVVPDDDVIIATRGGMHATSGIGGVEGVVDGERAETKVGPGAAAVGVNVGVDVGGASVRRPLASPRKPGRGDDKRGKDEEHHDHDHDHVRAVATAAAPVGPTASPVPVGRRGRHTADGARCGVHVDRGQERGRGHTAGAGHANRGPSRTGRVCGCVCARVCVWFWPAGC